MNTLRSPGRRRWLLGMAATALPLAGVADPNGLHDWGLAPEFTGISAGLFNQMGSVAGLQAGLFNNAAHDMTGFQFGLFNVADDAAGFQIGLINRTVSLRGLQIGLVNLNADGPVTFFPFLNASF